ncbi:chorismate mutase/prephenate dehydratase [Myxococcus xanthus DK 1622]|uniref:Bifunctional chorismate mutase/prephenate dehydratase n=1 Tax=Myxococcus xanthus (strain DK1622) TaxID=246197 RepID=Q1D7F3_MYXXD|nr:MULTISPECIES: bifunctional chorismate mutase/prephenate dehydratase [Myxococcus]ABF89557.1 chorismate mutase/prephenate dehydratase [Myxococcus xanthus DK 1622]NOJ55735.1 chorismate mutase [Myxococcus xanthus]QPM82667.1 chorismate mutase [Myxococcus xanthus]QVW64972.1 chorismate mutase [Myxococcus xanthus DZ2]QZZ50925.1 Bifunctional chorismate mutase/prephenate dehydratase [Myxococcus xanthus]
MTTLPDLDLIRTSIERIDEEILDALRRRMALADDVARAKLAAAAPFRDQRREDLLLRRIRTRAAEHGLDPHEVERIWRLFIDMSVARQHELVTRLDTTPLRVAYPGVEGSYSHLAARRRYGHRAGGVLLSGFDHAREAVEALRRGEQDLVLLPIENTTAGSMNETYDLLAEGGVVITAELVSQVDHRLLGLPGAKLEGLREVLSHPQALAQCETFLREKVPWARAVPDVDTGGAAQKVRERNDASVAAIASETAAQRFGLEVLAGDLQPAFDYTRFVEVGREASPLAPGVPCKTSLLVVLEHKPGTLGEMLQRLTLRGVNLSKLESRPIPGQPWQYRFYLDVEGHAASAAVTAALDDIRPLTSSLRVLGTYARAESPHA